MPDGAIEDPHDLLRELRRFMGRRRGDAILMGEVNLPPDEQRAFFGDEDGDELHMVLNFTVNQAMYLALARGEAEPLVRALRSLPEIPRGQPVGELRAQPRRADARQAGRRRARRRCSRPSAPRRDLQLYGRGLRRRLPSMVGGDQRPHPPRLLARLLPARHAGALLRRGDRDARRTWRSTAATACASPMQWSSERHRGFYDRRRAVPAARARRRGGGGPAARPGLAPELDGAADPPPPRVPRARLGPDDAARRRRSRRASPTARTGTAAPCSPSTRSRRSLARCGSTSATPRRSSTSSVPRSSHPPKAPCPWRSAATGIAGSGCADRDSG